MATARSPRASPRAADLAESRRRQLESDYGQLGVAFLCDTQSLFATNPALLSRRVLDRYRTELRELLALYEGVTQKRLVVIVNFFSTESLFRFFGTGAEDPRASLRCMTLDEALVLHRRHFAKTLELLQLTAGSFALCACVTLKPSGSPRMTSPSVDLQGVHSEVVRLSELALSPRAG